ncbi:MAG: zf-HC2 domain-containing protein [Gemmatimonadetes bacterium]|nr:zf-HC2 domain-containing protein [Gemmatimonadota bacterium]
MGFFHRLKRMFGGKASSGHGHDHTPGHDCGHEHEHGSTACQEAVSLLYDYLDGELRGVSEERVKAHFELCRMCHPHVRFEESFRAALKRATAGEAPPPELKDHLLDLLKEA